MRLEWLTAHPPVVLALLLVADAAAGAIAFAISNALARRRALEAVIAARAGLVDALRRAHLAAGGGALPVVPSDIQEALRTLDGLEQEARRRGLPAPYLREQAQALGRLRGYLLPLSDLEELGVSGLAQLRGWDLPEARLAELERRVRRQEGMEHLEAGARAAFCHIQEQCDSRGRLMERHFSQMTAAVWVLGTVALFGLYWALTLFSTGHAISGFIVAGACGTAVSIVLKLPPVDARGERAGFFIRAAARFCAGVIATAVGCGLLASGLINLAVPSGGEVHSLGMMISRCSASPGEAGRASPSEPLPSGQGGCAPEWGVLLLGLGILIGFSERALVSFQQAVLGGTLGTPPPSSTGAGRLPPPPPSPPPDAPDPMATLVESAATLNTIPGTGGSRG